MKKLSVLALLLGAMFFATNASAEMKCGGDMAAKTAQSEKPACCTTKPAPNMDKPACCEAKAAPKKAMKCGAGKCGGTDSKPERTAPKESMKCGTGKCA
ncbi:hypothetical protein JHD48_05245 [Sulfurimonas sp. SAG-AH-194-I05]|nr:hypothetical protein [Sulfurimonas sp. SAG-AH-194-I05]MDF1875132.1 hypothetical protein [Sulfurimonas sp. SAG-AH-194-I05]